MTPPVGPAVPAGQSMNGVEAVYRAAGETGPTRSILAAILLTYLAFRLPFVLKQPGGQDEQLFSVPGYTVATEGIPRIPYYPARNPKCVFYRTDECEFALPPGLFYLQAPFFWLFPAGYPTSRLPCLVAGMIAIGLVYALGRRAFGPAAGLWAAGMYAASRVLFFAAAFARPDEACAAFGLGAILVLWRYADEDGLKRIVSAGTLLGLGLLCHPFAVVYCLLCGIWVLIQFPLLPRRTFERLETVTAGEGSGLRDKQVATDSALTPGPSPIAAPTPKAMSTNGRGENWLWTSIRQSIGHAVVLTVTALAVLALWTPLILAYSDAFEKQFFNNVLDPAGPGLVRRLFWPIPYVAHQVQLVYEQAGVWQMAVMGVGLIGATLMTLRSGASAVSHRMMALIWAAIYLHTACQGLHPTKGYWCFTGALVFIAAGAVVALLTSRLSAIGRPFGCAAAIGIAALFVPQSGIRLWWAQIRPWPDSRYDGPRFVQELIAALPAEGRYVVEPAFVFDFWLAGRDVIVRVEPRDYLIDQYEYDWLVVSRDGLEKSIPSKLNGEFVRSFGPEDDPLACYAEVYRPASK